MYVFVCVYILLVSCRVVWVCVWVSTAYWKFVKICTEFENVSHSQCKLKLHQQSISVCFLFFICRIKSIISNETGLIDAIGFARSEYKHFVRCRFPTNPTNLAHPLYPPSCHKQNCETFAEIRETKGRQTAQYIQRILDKRAFIHCIL